MQRNASIVPEICFVFVDGWSPTRTKRYIRYRTIIYGSSFVLRTKKFSLSACFVLPFEEDGADELTFLRQWNSRAIRGTTGWFAIDATKSARWANLHVVFMVATKPHLGALAIWQSNLPWGPMSGIPHLPSSSIQVLCLLYMRECLPSIYSDICILYQIMYHRILLLEPNLVDKYSKTTCMLHWPTYLLYRVYFRILARQVHQSHGCHGFMRYISRMCPRL